jgi:DNA invertase Pin-like site-specific DNA recombinase
MARKSRKNLFDPETNLSENNGNNANYASTISAMGANGNAPFDGSYFGTNGNISYPTVYKTAGYVRLSSEDSNKKGNSIETQKAIIQNHLKTLPDIYFQQFYIDNGRSGTTFKRPAFEQLLSDIENGKINCIIVKDLSRFGRNSIDAGYYMEKYFPSKNVRFISVTDDYDSTQADIGMSFLVPLKNLINETYALDIGRKIKSQKDCARAEGRYTGGGIPYGYRRITGNNNPYSIDPYAAEVVRQIFNWAEEGMGMASISRHLNEAKILTPLEYYRQEVSNRKSNQSNNGVWYAASIKLILKNPVYIGDLPLRKNKDIKTDTTDIPDSLSQNTHEAIISREQFTLVQNLLQEKKTIYIQNNQKHERSANIFREKLYCGSCGAALTRRKRITRPDHIVFEYSCSTRVTMGKGKCSGLFIRESVVRRTLATILQKHAEAVTNQATQIRRDKKVQKRKIEMKRRLQQLRQKAARISGIKQSLYESLAQELITREEYQNMKMEYEEKNRELGLQMLQIQTDILAIENQAEEYCRLSDLIQNEQKTGISDEAINSLINKIVIYPDRSMTAQFAFQSGYDLLWREIDNG